MACMTGDDVTGLNLEGREVGEAEGWENQANPQHGPAGDERDIPASRRQPRPALLRAGGEAGSGDPPGGRRWRGWRRHRRGRLRLGVARGPHPPTPRAKAAAAGAAGPRPGATSNSAGAAGVDWTFPSGDDEPSGEEEQNEAIRCRPPQESLSSGAGAAGAAWAARAVARACMLSEGQPVVAVAVAALCRSPPWPSRRRRDFVGHGSHGRNGERRFERLSKPRSSRHKQRSRTHSVVCV
jgi:hypothetical protein